MYELSRTESVEAEAAVLVGVSLHQQGARNDSLEELEGLADTAGVQVVGRLTQRRETPDAATYLGRGKVEELSPLGRGHRRRPGHLRQRPDSRPDPQPGKGARA